MIEQRVVNIDMQERLIKAGHSSLIARILAARQILSVSEVDLSLSLLPHFNLLKNIHAVSQLLANAIIEQKKIIVAGDYDADGATSCAVAIKSISAMGGLVDFLVPCREKDGYGLSNALVDRATDKAADVIITVDNGISSIQSVVYAKSKGIKVVITDHHLPGTEVPECLIVNPNQTDCLFPSKNLAGVGVIFYVMLALRSQLDSWGYFKCRDKPNLSYYLDLVACGTVSDVVKLDHVNRILVNHGLKLIRLQKGCHGIQALFDVAQKSSKEAQTFDLGFILGPRLNAPGRLDDITMSIRCLLAENYQTAYAYALQLDALNQQRKKTEVEMLALTEEELSFNLNEKQTSIVMFSEKFHQGIIGILAARLKEQYYLPTIIFAKGDGNEIRGSGRSIPGFHMRDTLDLVSKKAPGLILKFGGHAMAAGLSIDADRFEKFKQVFEATAREILNIKLLRKVFLIDGGLDVVDINLTTAKQLDSMIWGQDFELPKFFNRFEVLEQKLVGRQKHLKVTLKKDQRCFNAIFFNCQDNLPREVNLVYHLVVNQWNQREELQLYIDYWEEALDAKADDVL